MSSTPKKRLKRKPSKSSSSSIETLIEPPPWLFPSKSELLRLAAVIFIATSVAVVCNFFFAAVYRQPRPFCDSSIDFDNSFPDICDPCPRNGKCYEDKWECAHGYRKQGRLCIEDGDISEKAKKLTEMVETHVCEAYARFLCDGSGIVWAREDEIWGNLDEPKIMEFFGMDSTIYLHTKRMAMDAIGNLLETRTKVEGIKEIKCPDLLAEHYKPFTCQIRQWISEHALVLMPVLLLLLGSTFSLRKFHKSRCLSLRAEDLYHQICDVLEERAGMSKSASGETEPWIVVSWLRDHLLLPRERKDPALWKKVEMLVQEDSRVDRYPKLVQGESKVVWEWQVEGPLSSSKMRKTGGLSNVKPSKAAAPYVFKQSPEMKSSQVIYS